MKLPLRTILAVAIAAGVGSSATTVMAQSFTDTITGGKMAANFRLRFEGVDEDRAVDEASALTLRSALKYTTATKSGWSAVLEVEDVSIVGIDNYTVGPTGFNPGQYSVIGDPESTEVNQSYVQYSDEGFTFKLGRQDIRYDNQRFIGAVPWRQDWQTFDALSVGFKDEKFSLDYNYLTQRNRIFADEADIDSKDHLLHGSMATPIGKLTAYGYLLEMDVPTDNSLDTWGMRLTGSKKSGDTTFTYVAEYATQDMDNGAVSREADYFLLEGGMNFGKLTAKLGYESLGSDNGNYGFATPLATAHAFNGWADQFLGTPVQGIDDMYLNLSTPLGTGNFTFIYHDFDADNSAAGVDDLGSEVDLQWTTKFAEKYTFGAKFASYSDGDLTAKVDKKVFWSWVQLAF